VQKQKLKTILKKRIESDAIVSNMEVIPSYRKLPPLPGNFDKKIRRLEPACSGVLLHLGVNRTYPQLAITIFTIPEIRRIIWGCIPKVLITWQGSDY
jgi:hypothetical protein